MPSLTLGRYHIERRIASGGMADVYLARQTGAYGFEKRVALKVLKQEIAGDDENVKMFIREALVASEFRHPNLAQIYEVGEEGGRLFIAMELIRGVSIAALLRGLADREKGMPMNVAVRIAIDALDGLAHAHEATDPQGKPLGLVHRDVSPQNIMVASDGSVKLVDFGIARAELAFGKTLAPRIKGKFSYMSPEQWEADGRLDARADVFSLGVVLYEMTTGGVRLFKGDSPKDLYKAIVFDEIADPRSRIAEYPAELAAIVMRALERGPGARWPSARAMKIALLQFAQGCGWSLTSRVVADTLRDALGSIDIESRWEPVGESGIDATLAANDVVPPASPNAGGERAGAPGSAVTLTMSADPNDERRPTRQRHSAGRPSWAAVAAISAACTGIGVVVGYALGARGDRSRVGTNEANAATPPGTTGTPGEPGPLAPHLGGASGRRDNVVRLRVRGFDAITEGTGATEIRRAFQVAHPDVELEMSRATSADAIAAVVARRADVAIASREPSQGELASARQAQIELDAPGARVSLGRAAAFVIVHATHPRATLDLAGVRGWFGVAGAAAPTPAPTEPPAMHPFARGVGNDLLALVDARLFEGQRPAGLRSLDGDAEALRAVSDDPQGVTVVALSALTTSQANVRVLLETTAPAPASGAHANEWREAASHTPFAFRLWAVAAGESRGAARSFIDWIRAPENAPVLAHASFVRD